MSGKQRLRKSGLYPGSCKRSGGRGTCHQVLVPIPFFLSLYLLFISRNFDSDLCLDPKMKSLCNTSFRKANISFSHCLDTNIVLQSCGGASVEVEHRNTKVPGYKDDLLAYFPSCVNLNNL